MRAWGVMAVAASIVSTNVARAETIKMECRFAPASEYAQPDIVRFFEKDIGREREITVDVKRLEAKLEPHEATRLAKPSVRIDDDELRIEWQIIALWTGRNPQLILSVDRFKGKAQEFVAMRETVGGGGSVGHLGRHGRCQVFRRQF